MLGVAFGAADEALTVAASLSLRSPFVVHLDPMEPRLVLLSSDCPSDLQPS